MPPPPKRRTDLLIVALLVPLLAAALVGRSQLEVDAENVSMKSVGTDVAAGVQMRNDAFGPSPRVVVLIESTSSLPPDGDAIEAWTEQLGGDAAVTAIETAPKPGPNSACLAIDVFADRNGRYAAQVERLEGLIAQTLPPGLRATLTGLPVIEIAIATEVAQERARILPALVAALAAVLWFVQRRARLVVATLAAPLATVIVLEGVQGFLGLPVDPISSLLGPAVLAVGVASAVHIVEAYRCIARSGDSADPAANAVRKLRVPLLLTLVTTVAGFLGLLASPIPAIRRFGWLASLGIIITMGAAFVLLPALLRLFDARGSHSRGGAPVEVERPPPLERPRWRAAPFAAVALGIWFASQSLGVGVDSNPLHVLAPSDPTRIAAESVAERLGGDAVFDLLLPPPGPAGPLALLSLAPRLYALPTVAGPAGKPQTGRGGVVRIPLLLAPATSDERGAAFDQVEELGRTAGWSEATATGIVVSMSRDSRQLVSGQRRGILAVSLGLWIVMSIGFRSLRIGALGLLPNLLPVAVLQGSLGLLGRPLTLASSMIGTVMLGIIIDNTIHLLHAYRSAGGSRPQRVTRALAEVRRPVLITTAVLCAGFGATLLGRLGATREFGVMAIVTLLIALVADLWLLPAFLSMRAGVQRK